MCVEEDNRDPSQAPELRVVMAADGAECAAYLAPAPVGRSGLVLLPDVNGLRPMYQEIADRFAAAGATTLVIDYYGRTAGAEPHGEDFDRATHVASFSRDTLLLDVTAAVAQLAAIGCGPVYVAGFCVGGANALYAGARVPGLAGVIAICAWTGAIGLSAELPEEHGRDMPVPVLGLFGGADDAVPVAVPENLDRQLDAAGVEHRVVVYPGQPHGFVERDHLGEAGHAEPAADAWRRIAAFLTDGRLVD